MVTPAVDVRDVEAAAARLRGRVEATPVFQSRTFSRMTGAPIWLKAENLQRTGSFKIRGAANAIALLDQAQRARGVVAASAGNHAQGVALAAHEAGIAATVVMPRSATFAKIAATRGYGATVILHGGTFADAVARADEIALEEGRVFISAFDDPAVIAGQGTIGLELLRQVPELGRVVVPVGGGGLIAGIAVALKSRLPAVEVIGVQAAAGPAVLESLREGRRVTVHPDRTIADGIAVSTPGEMTLPLIERYVDRMVTASEEEITRAMVLLLERAKLLVEGAGAVGLAAMLAGQLPANNVPTLLLLSGGNVDANLLVRALEHGLAHAGRYLVVTTVLEDLPGRLARLLTTLGDAGVNVLDIEHRKRGPDLGLDQVRVTITAETRDADHTRDALAALRAAGYDPRLEMPQRADPRPWL